MYVVESLKDTSMPEQGTLAERIRRFAFENYVAPMRDAPVPRFGYARAMCTSGWGLAGECLPYAALWIQ